jgi:hypothetical protein
VTLGAPNRLLFVGGTTTPPPPPSGLTASISGDDYLYGISTGYWSATATGGNGSYTYQWQYRAETSSTWTNVGTNSPSYSRNVANYAPSFYLRVIVTSGGASVTSAQFYVYHEPGEPMCGKYYC